MQRLLYDDHVHSCVCSCEAHDPVSALCRAADGAGLAGLTITDHFDTDPKDQGYGYYDFERLSRAVEAARGELGHLSILIGAEVCFQPPFERRIRDFLASSALDFVLGAVHYVRGEFVDRAYFERHGARTGYSWYLEAVEQAVATGLFDSLGHLDYAKRHGTAPCGPFDPTPHWQRIERILRLLIERGMALEINSSGWRHSPGECYPGEAILRRYRELGGTRLSLGSDAHCAADVGRDIARATELARRLGFGERVRFVGRRPEVIPL